MEKRTTDNIIMKLLEAKGSMEQAGSLSSHMMDRVKALDPTSKIRVLQLFREITHFQETKDTMGRSAAKSLAKAAFVRRATTIPTMFRVTTIKKTQALPPVSFCYNCGAKVTRAGAFCGSCGSRLTQEQP